VNLNGQVTSELVKGEVLGHTPSFRRSAAQTLIRGVEFVAINLYGWEGINSARRLRIESLPEQLRVGLSRLPVLVAGRDDLQKLE